MADKQSQQNTKLVTASAKGLHLSPRKMRLVTNMVKGMRAVDAMTQLQFVNKKGALYMDRLIRSAIANAENNFSLSAENLYIKTITCNMGQTMKRYFPRARGSAFVIRRKLSAVNLVLEERPGQQKKSRFSLLKRTKKEKPAPTVEGSIGVPETSEGPEVKGEKNIAESAALQPDNAENNKSVMEEKAGEHNQSK
jgi:large subunit ribosomal protein L22